MIKLKIRRILTVLCCCFLCWGLWAVPISANMTVDEVAASLEEGTTIKGAVSAFPGATLWEGASTSSGVIDRVVINTSITVNAVVDGWYQVTTYSGQEGYMQPSSIKLANTMPSPTMSVAVTNGTGIHLRSGAGTDYSVVSTMPYATVLTILSSVTGSDNRIWAQATMANGVSGYVRSDLITPLTTGNGILSGKIIVIDPGHGYNRKALYDGAVGNILGLKEKDVNLTVSNLLRDQLEELGATVVLTRETDRGALSLTDRAVVANDLGADVFISIHCNASDATSAHGTETYYYPLTAAQKTADYIAAQRAAGNIPDDVPNSQVDVPAEYTMLTAADKNLNEQRKTLATAVQNGMLASMQRSDRGVKSNEPFTVIKATTVPSILVELAFLSNKEEEALLATDTFQIKTATGICNGIVEYLTGQ